MKHDNTGIGKPHISELPFKFKPGTLNAVLNDNPHLRAHFDSFLESRQKEERELIYVTNLTKDLRFIKEVYADE